MTSNAGVNDGIEFRLFRGSDGLQELEVAWRTLQGQIPDLRFIHHYGWFSSYLESSEHEADAVVFAVALRSERPVAIFPLHRTIARRFGIPLRTWEILWPNDMGICDFVFEKTEANHELLMALTRFLREDKTLSWDLLRLQDTLDDSCAQYSMRVTTPALSVTVMHHYSKYIPCSTDYETTMSRLSGDFRRNLRRQAKKVAELGQIEYRFVNDAQEMDNAFNHFLHAEASSWKGDAGAKSAIQLYENKVRFYRTLVDEFTKYNACSINLILLNGQCIASQFCLTTGDTLYLLKIGYSEEHKALGPGNVLLNELIQRCCADNKINKISFVTGAPWNDRWSPSSLEVFESTVFNTTVPGLSAYVLERTKNYGRHVKHRIQAVSRKYSMAGNTRKPA